ncbi:MAG TPA: DUF555 domain-containing protein [Methanocorpusculum sp.]|nr:DUF555 domain-containing protein [Methanocorpusculum sp.]
MSDYRVTLEAAWIVKDVSTAEDAIGIAVSEVGKRLHISAKFVDVDIMIIPCPYCGKEINSALVVARTCLVGLLLSMKVFNAENENHSARIAKSVIGRAIRDVPLAIYSIISCDEEEDLK